MATEWCTDCVYIALLPRVCSYIAPPPLFQKSSRPLDNRLCTTTRLGVVHRLHWPRRAWGSDIKFPWCKLPSEDHCQATRNEWCSWPDYPDLSLYCLGIIIGMILLCCSLPLTIPPVVLYQQSVLSKHAKSTLCTQRHLHGLPRFPNISQEIYTDAVENYTACCWFYSYILSLLQGCSACQWDDCASQ